jgi:flagellar biosynthesis anti-sigma factor FlgM
VRIDLYNSTAATEATDQVTRLNQAKTAEAQKQLQAQKSQADNKTEDKTTLSSSSDSVASLAQIALQPSPSRQTRLEALKQQVSSAQYQLDSAKIAEALSSAEF